MKSLKKDFNPWELRLDWKNNMLIKKSQAQEKQNDKHCTIWEYNFPNENLGFATAKIDVRHPTEGKILNEKCDEIYYVISGKGIVYINDKEFKIEKGDACYIEKGREFYVEGEDLFIALPTNPAWYLEQYREVK